MSMTPFERVKCAQDFFRFAYLVGGPISFGMKVTLPKAPSVVVFGRHSLYAEDFELPEEAFGFCGTILEHLAYRLLAMELDSALMVQFKGGDRFGHINPFIRNASIVIRLIRNSVAHNVLEPVWKIDRRFRNKRFEIDELLIFDTTSLNGRRLNRLDFGGPIALFRLSEKLMPFLHEE